MIAGDGSAVFVPNAAQRTRKLTAAASVLQLGGLATVLAGGPVPAAVTLVAVGGLAGASALVPRVLTTMRRERGWILFALVLLGLSWWVAVAIMRLAHTSLDPLPWPVPSIFGRAPAQPVAGRAPLLAAIALSASAGLVLVADAVRVWVGLAPLQRAPWTRMTELRERPDGIAWRGLGGVLMVALAAFLAIGYSGPYVRGSATLQVVVFLLVAGAAALMIGTPVAVGLFLRVDRDKAGSAREVERQRFAAHLHDSVLQTLALVQRQAHDPAVVARLARRQEYALRAWMAGEAELLSETVAAALRDAVATVEDEYGITVELAAIGDRPLDPAGEALVAAAREALRNAARHAGGSRVFVFADISDRDVEVFVRDDGPGFDAHAVPAERRGIRDAIVGRMASAGGVATVESAPGEGTEVALRIRAGKGKR